MRTPEVSKLLRQVRLNAGMTQQELADVLMVDKAYISRVENGHQIPDAMTYNNWLAATKGPIVAFEYVFGNDGGWIKFRKEMNGDVETGDDGAVCAAG